MAKDKKIQRNTFSDGSNSDWADIGPEGKAIPPSQVRFYLNCTPFGIGTKGKVVTVPGNLLIPNTLPAGNNICIGWGSNEEKSKFYWFNYNDQGFHAVYCYNDLTETVIPILQNLIDTNNIDIFHLSADFLINHVDIIADNLIYWVDGLNKARKFNLDKALDKSTTGYGTVVTEDFITAYKQCGVYAPSVVYFTDLTRPNNYCYSLQFKFAYRFYYDDKEISNWGDYSAVPLPPNESYLGVGAISYNNNGINVTVATGNKLVTKIEIAVKINNLDWVGCAMLNKSQLSIDDYTVYTYSFYNDGAYWDLDQDDIARPYSFLPRVPFIQSFVKIAMTYGNFNEGFPVVNIIASAVVTFTPFYLPSGTVSQLNDPAFTTTTLSVSEHGGIFNSWWTTVTHFVVGHDVVKGNIFSITYTGGNGTSTSFNVEATVGDTSTTIASSIKAYLRTIDAVGTGTISGESISDGNVLWDFTIEAHEGKPAIIFKTSVNPVNYSTLLDDGLSINTIKQGSTRKYAVVYEDDDGRTSLGYTCDGLLVPTPYETETILGSTTPIGLQQPIHTISIFSQPPVWAKYWRLVRTSDYGSFVSEVAPFIQMLIQQVNEVVVANEPTYLDLVVGSVFTYQKIHPDTIITYEFLRGDRLRLISDDSGLPGTPAVPYTPYYETEVLGYTTDEEIPVNANINTTIGTPSVNVTPSDGVNTGYVGKNIIIQDVERTIVSISGTDYILNEPLSLEQATSATLYTVPSYTIVDRRGILRIKKPPATYNVVDFSLVEVSHPAVNANNGDYQDFADFQQKYAISNWGTDTRAHMGNVQNQDGTNSDTLASTPAIVQTTQGDAYVRNRALPSNNQDPNPQEIIDQICDPNYSDFYVSNLYSTGRIYPQDQGLGEVYFGSRERFSSNFIENTQINGLNDFNDTDRKDYNDAYGVFMRSIYLRGMLYLFKQLKNTWTPVAQNIIVDNQGNSQLVTSDELLNDLQYAVWEGGVGNNPEGIFVNGDYIYVPSTNSGAFLRIAQDGTQPISQLFFYDKTAKDILSLVNKYNLRLYGGYDKLNDRAFWSTPDFIQYLYNNSFNAPDWQTAINAYPDGTTFAVTQQPANSTATVVGNQIQITETTVLGNDFFKFQGTLPDSSLTPILNFCFTVVDNPNKTTIWVGKSGTLYCLQQGGGNSGQEGFQVLNEEYQADNTLTGNIMPNVYMIDPNAIIPDTATITFNTTDVTPTGGSLGDIWYNAPSDALYKNIGGGVWQILTNKVINTNYIPPVENITDCPIPPPPDAHLAPVILSIDRVVGEVHFDFELDMALGPEITIAYSVDYIQGGTTYHPIIDETTNIVSGTTSPDINFIFDPDAGDLTDIIFTYTPTPNPAGGITIDYVSPQTFVV